MAAFNGRWKLISCVKNVEFMKDLGHSDSFIESAKPYSDPDNDIQEEYIIGDTEVTSVIFKGGEEQFRQTVARGTDVPFTDLGGKTAKITTTIEGNTMTSVQDFGDVKATYLLQVDGDNMDQKFISSKGAVSTRKMKRV